MNTTTSLPSSGGDLRSNSHENAFLELARDENARIERIAREQIESHERIEMARIESRERIDFTRNEAQERVLTTLVHALIPVLGKLADGKNISDDLVVNFGRQDLARDELDDEAEAPSAPHG